MDLTSFYNANGIFLDSIDRDPREWDGYTIVNIIYSDKKAKTGRVYAVSFWVPVKRYYELLSAPSQGSEYYWNWSVYGNQEVWYNNQDFGMPDDEENEDNDGYIDAIPDRPIEATSIDLDDYVEAMQWKEQGKYEEWVREKRQEMNDQQKDEFSKLMNAMETSDELYMRTMRMRELIAREELTGKQMFKMIFRDIEEMFGVSLQSKVKFQFLQGIDMGKLSPQKMKSYNMKIKNIYDALEKDGVKGASQIGRRFVNSKNTLVRNRKIYKGKEAIKSVMTKSNMITGNEAVQQIQKFHNKVLKEEAKGIMKKNNMYLEQKVLKDGTKAYSWKKEVSFGRRIINVAKKVLRIAKFFII